MHTPIIPEPSKRGKAALPPEERFRESKTGFHKQLKWLIHNPPEGSVLMNIAPAMSEIMMERNEDEEWKNRPKSRLTVDAYTRQMKIGWRLTGETIIFSKSGHLLNGQNRLAAAIKASESFPCHVVFGMEEDAFKFIDIGKRRTAGDIFSIKRVPNAIAISAATGWLWKYHNTGMSTPSSLLKPTNDELYQYYLEHQDLQKSYGAGRRFATYKILNAAVTIMLHYEAARKNRALADEWFERLATGIGFTTTRDPAAKLRQLLIDDKTQLKRYGELYLAAFTVQAWNAMRQNKPVKVFRWRTEQAPNVPFPRIV